MTREEAVKIQVGDVLLVNYIHNLVETKRRRHLPETIVVRALTRHSNTGTGVSFLVETIKGSRIWVDASYFEA